MATGTRPARQLSLHSEPATPERRRKALKKQFSQDVPEKKPPPAPARLAWAEREAGGREESIVVKKCKEVRRPTTAKPTVGRDSILADRLRNMSAWKEREGSRRNLNIFLTHATGDQCQEKENALSNRENPKIVEPLRPGLLDGDLKHAFQKQMRKTRRNLLPPRTSPVQADDKKPHQEDAPKTSPVVSVVIRPGTASSKREGFQKRTNSAFNALRNPLTRTSSLPTPSKPKFTPTKRRVKSASKRTAKEEAEANGGQPGPQPCDIVTMVSLISNSGSEAEESDDGAAGKEEGRKVVKSVSFQQSTIHAVRSFSASFPGRRGAAPKDQQKAQEKRATTDAMQDEEESVAKRRLLRGGERSRGSIDEDNPDIPTATPQDEAAETKPGEPRLDTHKEKQCWDLYRKMNEKGVSVSFDTILRGMLTPTEYRLHRKQSLVGQDNC